ncbi:ATP-dependent nuclease [Pseudomonas viridiflava]|uniref:ATP-dependent nuclease n=1 Tax=Pseudomonas viridiflava TaxID=33069 RepID=UPI000F02D932|nr:AAA family ATPase [Pseudomonas viridiflava]
MKITKFRIKNFRSIIDTDWRNFSADGVTVLVGQNESGKSAILEALSLTFSRNHITNDDLRYDCELPEIWLALEFSESQFDKALVGNATEEDIKTIQNHFKRVGHRTQCFFKWYEDPEAQDRNFSCEIDLNEPELSRAAMEYISKEGENLTADSNLSHIAAIAIFRMAPTFTLFQSSSGLLPNTIEIDSSFNLVGEGKSAADNLLTIANINLKDLIKQDSRTQESKIARAINEINLELKDLWNQKIGSNNKIKLEFSLKHHANNSSKKAGDPYLTFWVSDGMHKLHPKQRSTGVRWFISFYLQLKASQKHSEKLHFLLDEPGANLHANAQKDVLKLINRLSKDIPITYSTHSPTLIEYEKLYRVYAVQRGNDEMETPTELIEAHHLGAASSDTLSPILTAIGTDFSQQNVIQKTNNIILEEPSAFYYLSAFWLLLRIPKRINFISATGANKIPPLAYMFTGWGLKFSVIVDDDNQGRQVFNQLKKDLWGDEDNIAKNNAYKLKGCNGIEDIFSKQDFATHVLKNELHILDCAPSEIVKLPNYSKPILAYSFYLSVKSKEIELDRLEETTTKKINEVFNNILNLIEIQNSGN